MEPALYTTRVRADETDELPLFAPVAEEKPETRPNHAPSQRKSTTSKNAADSLTLSSLSEQHTEILRQLDKNGGVMSRWDLHLATQHPKIAVNVLCARIPELAPKYLEVAHGACWSHAKPNMRVDGYRITDAGRVWVRGRPS